MFTVNLLAGALDTLELADSSARSVVVVAPGRGGMVTAFKSLGRDVLYLDEATLHDRAKNVRGGIPILFPNPGVAQPPMKQHGFARDMPWEVVRTGNVDGATATLRLVATDETRAIYPYAFVLEMTYTLRGNKLRLEARVRNDGNERMPFGFGFHPYFPVPQEEKPGARVETGAARAWDNVQKKEIRIERLQLARPEIDLHLLDHGSLRSALTWLDDRVTIEVSKELTRWVVWTVHGPGFVCLEPWTCGGDALATGEGLQWLEPGEARVIHAQLTAEMKEAKKKWERDKDREENT